MKWILHLKKSTVLSIDCTNSHLYFKYSQSVHSCCAFNSVLFIVQIWNKNQNFNRASKLKYHIRCVHLLSTIWKIPFVRDLQFKQYTDLSTHIRIALPKRIVPLYYFDQIPLIYCAWYTHTRIMYARAVQQYTIYNKHTTQATNFFISNFDANLLSHQKCYCFLQSFILLVVQRVILDLCVWRLPYLFICVA